MLKFNYGYIMNRNAILRVGNKFLTSKGPKLLKVRGPHQNQGALTQQIGKQLEKVERLVCAVTK